MGQRKSEIIKNHMEVYWHDYASASKGIPITEAGLVEKASVIGRTGLMLLECGTLSRIHIPPCSVHRRLPWR